MQGNGKGVEQGQGVKDVFRSCDVAEYTNRSGRGQRLPRAIWEPVPAAPPCLRLTNAYSQRQGGDRKNDRIELKERNFYLTNGKN